MSSSSSSNPSHEVILQHFSTFLSKLLQNNPTAQHVNDDFKKLHQLLLHRPLDMSNIYGFLSSLNSINSPDKNTPPPNPKISSPLAITPQDDILETIDRDSQKFPYSSINRFTLSSFKDYLNRYSIVVSSSFLEQSSTSSLLNSCIRDFLPDSENFYRALGLGLIELYLIEPEFKDRLRCIHNRIQAQEMVLYSDAYPFSPKDLKDTFCGYIVHLLSDEGISSDPARIRELLYTMTTRNVVFDAAIVSLVKCMIEEYFTKHPSEMPRKASPRNLFDDLCNPPKLRMDDSGIITDIIEYIPKIFGISLIVMVVENKSIRQLTYKSKAEADPKVYLLNERHREYQNFALVTPDLQQQSRLEMTRSTEQPFCTLERMSLNNEMLEPSEIYRITENKGSLEYLGVFSSEGRKSGEQADSRKISINEEQRAIKGSSEDIHTTNETQDDTREEAKEFRSHLQSWSKKENQYNEVYEGRDSITESPDVKICQPNDWERRPNPFKDVYNREEDFEASKRGSRQGKYSLEQDYRTEVKEITPAFGKNNVPSLRVMDDDDDEDSDEDESMDENIDKSWRENPIYNRSVNQIRGNFGERSSFERELQKQVNKGKGGGFMAGKENIYSKDEEVRSRKVSEPIISQAEIGELLKKYGLRKY